MKCRPTRANLARVQDGLSLSADADADDLGGGTMYKPDGKLAAFNKLH